MKFNEAREELKKLAKGRDYHISFDLSSGHGEQITLCWMHITEEDGKVHIVYDKLFSVALEKMKRELGLLPEDHNDISDIDDGGEGTLCPHPVWDTIDKLFSPKGE